MEEVESRGSGKGQLPVLEEELRQLAHPDWPLGTEAERQLSGIVKVQKVGGRSVATRYFSKYPLRLMLPSKVWKTPFNPPLPLFPKFTPFSLLSGCRVSVGCSLGVQCELWGGSFSRRLNLHCFGSRIKLYRCTHHSVLHQSLSVQ